MKDFVDVFLGCLGMGIGFGVSAAIVALGYKFYLYLEASIASKADERKLRELEKAESLKADDVVMAEGWNRL